MKKICWIFLALMVFNIAFAQRQEDVRFNELMGINENAIIDEFGHHQPWCELMNTSYGSVNIGGMYLSNNKNNLKQYQIPATSNMILPPQSFTIFFLDSNNNYGVFHTNFKLKPQGTLYLITSDGKHIVDSVTYSFEKADEVLARFPDGTGSWKKTTTFTPRQNNFYENIHTSNDVFSQHDPYGIGVSLICIFVVFLALVLLSILFNFIGNYFSKSLHIKIPVKKFKKTSTQQSEQEETILLSGEVTAAIATALYLYQAELHDEEAAIITIKRTSKPYSPWSSKIYMLRQYPTKQSLPRHFFKRQNKQLS